MLNRCSCGYAPTNKIDAGCPIPTSPTVDLVAAAYEWICPACEALNREIEAKPQVRCAQCGTDYQTNPPEHAYP